MRIAGFRHKALERFWRDADTRGLPSRHIEKIRAMLSAIGTAGNLAEIERYSGWRLHQLKGDRHGTWSMTVTRNYRLTFKLLGSTVVKVGLEDYHGK